MRPTTVSRSWARGARFTRRQLRSSRMLAPAPVSPPAPLPRRQVCWPDSLALAATTSGRQPSRERGGHSARPRRAPTLLSVAADVLATGKRREGRWRLTPHADRLIVVAGWDTEQSTATEPAILAQPLAHAGCGSTVARSSHCLFGCLCLPLFLFTHTPPPTSSSPTRQPSRHRRTKSSSCDTTTLAPISAPRPPGARMGPNRGVGARPGPHQTWRARASAMASLRFSPVRARLVITRSGSAPRAQQRRARPRWSRHARRRRSPLRHRRPPRECRPARRQSRGSSRRSAGCSAAPLPPRMCTRIAPAAWSRRAAIAAPAAAGRAQLDPPTRMRQPSTGRAAARARAVATRPARLFACRSPSSTATRRPAPASPLGPVLA